MVCTRHSITPSIKGFIRILFVGQIGVIHWSSLAVYGILAPMINCNCNCKLDYRYVYIVIANYDFQSIGDCSCGGIQMRSKANRLIILNVACWPCTLSSSILQLSDKIRSLKDKHSWYHNSASFVELCIAMLSSPL